MKPQKPRSLRFLATLLAPVLGLYFFLLVGRISTGALMSWWQEALLVIYVAAPLAALLAVWACEEAAALRWRAPVIEMANYRGRGRRRSRKSPYVAPDSEVVLHAEVIDIRSGSSAS